MTTPSDQPVLKTHALRKQVSAPDGTLHILNGVDLEIAPSEAVSILGTSGSGKSTLLGLLAGLDQASAGQVELLGQDLGLLNEDGRAALRAGRVGFVFQAFHLLPGMTALENVGLPLELRGTPDLDQARRRLDEVGLSHRLKHYPNQLSGGEQQRVAIARAFMGPPDLLFADEPTGNLDPATGEKIMDALFALRDSTGAALVLVTHDQALAERCDRRLHLAEGILEAMR